MRRQLALTLFAACAACGDFVSLESFDPLPALEDLDFSQVSPRESLLVWEFRNQWQPGGYRVLGGAGRDGKDTLPPLVRLSFDNLTAQELLGSHCPPGLCYYYFASVDPGHVLGVYQTYPEVGWFLGDIGSREEAALLALAHGYQWQPGDRRVGGVRAATDGFELVVTRVVSYCAPVQVNRFLVRVATDGRLTELAEDVWRRVEDICI